MKRFGSLSEFADYLDLLALEVPEAQEFMAKQAGEVLVKQAKAEIGNPEMYHLQTGHFSAWPELAESTEALKSRLGYRNNAPLERTLQLHDSIQSVLVGLNKVRVFSDSPYAAYQEFGTLSAGGYTPPRPFIGTAVFIQMPLLVHSFAATLRALLAGQQWRVAFTFEGMAAPHRS